METIDAQDGVGLGAVAGQRLAVEHLAAGALDDVGVDAFHQHHPARQLVGLVADVLLLGLHRGRLHVGLEEIGARDPRPLHQLGEGLLGQPAAQRVFLSGARPEPERGQDASDAASHGGNGATGRAVGVAEDGERLARPRRRIVEPLDIGGAGQGAEAFRLVHHEVLGRARDGHVATAAEKAGDAHALRHVLARVPVVEIGFTGGLDVGPEGEDGGSQEAHGADPSRWPRGRRTWTAIVRFFERDERLFAVLLAVVMVGGLATLGLAPLRPRFRLDVFSLVMWFAAYKVCILAWVTVNPRATPQIFTGALAVDMLLVFALLYLTGGG